MIGLSQNIIIFLNMGTYWGLINISRYQQWPLKILFSSLSLKPQCKHCHNMWLYPKFLNCAQHWVVLYNIIIINVFSWVLLLLLLITIIKFFEIWVCNLRLLCLYKDCLKTKFGWQMHKFFFFLVLYFLPNILCIFFPFFTTNLKFTRKCQQKTTQTSTNLIIVCL